MGVMSPGVIECIQGRGAGGGMGRKQELVFRSNKLLSLKHSFELVEPGCVNGEKQLLICTDLSFI